MENESNLIAYILIGAIVWLFIMYHLIRYAVNAALYDHLKTVNFNLVMLNRLLIKLMLKKGFTKAELKEMHDQDREKFWDSLEENKGEELSKN